jgi:hypothetical protein
LEAENAEKPDPHDADFEEQLTRVCEKLKLPLELMRDGLKDSPVAA